jgi:hypothetical protein
MEYARRHIAGPFAHDPKHLNEACQSAFFNSPDPLNEHDHEQQRQQKADTCTSFGFTDPETA